MRRVVCFTSALTTRPILSGALKMISSTRYLKVTRTNTTLMCVIKSTNCYHLANWLTIMSAPPSTRRRTPRCMS